MTAELSDLPAILGGQPVVPAGPPAWPPLDPAIEERLRSCWADGTWSRYCGPQLDALNATLRTQFAVDHCLTCSSGTVAIELALRGSKIEEGDEVVLSAYDFRGNIQNVLTVGAVPVLVDVNPANWNIAVEQIAGAIGEKTRALLVSHLHGAMVPMAAVREIADAHNIALIEDACQMPGAMVQGRPAGSWGDVGAISFGGSKLLSAGRGGAVLGQRADIMQRIRLYNERGNQAYPLSELQAAVLQPQIDKLASRREHRRASVARIVAQLGSNADIRPFDTTLPDSIPDFYKLGIQYDASAFAGLSRDAFAAAVRAEGVALDPGFRSLHRTHSRRRFRAHGPLEEASRADVGVLTLHHPVLLGEPQDVDAVATAIEKVRTHAGTIASRSAD